MMGQFSLTEYADRRHMTRVPIGPDAFSESILQDDPSVAYRLP